MKIKEITSKIETLAPLTFQESYDNAGLLCGSPDQEIETVLIALDVTEKTIEEAIDLKAGLIISHHPLIFGGIKKLTGSNYVERTLIKAIQNNIAIYAAHTNIDNVVGGVNAKIAEKLNLQNAKILVPKENFLKKLVTFVPDAHAEKVRNAIFKAGAGTIGEYDNCSYNLNGTGSFRASESSNPFVGEKGKIHYEKETRVESIFPYHLQSSIIREMIKAHPYEKVAYDVYSLDNLYEKAGAGMTGTFESPRNEKELLQEIKTIFKTGCIKHTELLNQPVTKVAFCGGSGAHLIKRAKASGAQMYITGDVKYHQFFDAEKKIVIVDIGHYESEQFTMELFYEILTKKFPNFAFHFTKINSNPINYL